MLLGNCGNPWLFFVVALVGMLSISEGSSHVGPAEFNEAQTLDVNELDCGMRTLAWAFARDILDSTPKDTLRNNQVNENVLKLIHDALELSHVCQGKEEISRKVRENEKIEYHDRESSMENLRRPSYSRTLYKEKDGDGSDVDDGDSFLLNDLCNDEMKCIFVSAEMESTDNDQDGSRDKPWTSLHQALRHARSLMEEQRDDNDHITLMLRHGVHYLDGKPLKLSKFDDKLVVQGYPGEDSWISGGISLKDAVFKPATLEDHHNTEGVYVADLTDLLKGHALPKIPSLFTTNRRYFRARYPNGNPETDRLHGDQTIREDTVLEWTKLPPGIPPNFTFFDFAVNPPPGVPFKNDSTMDGYNQYASGHGGACSEVWGDEADSYWCSNSSAGGWAEVDRECAITGQMQLPGGMTYNHSNDALVPIRNATSLEGGFVFAWHSQSWAMHMFEITSHSQENSTMTFAKGGGKQGGRK